MSYVHYISYLGNPLGDVDPSDIIDIGLEQVWSKEFQFSTKIVKSKGQSNEKDWIRIKNKRVELQENMYSQITSKEDKAIFGKNVKSDTICQWF